MVISQIAIPDLKGLQMERKSKKGMSNYIIGVIAGAVCTALMVLGGYILDKNKSDADTMQKFAILTVGISGAVYVLTNRIISLRSKSRKPSVIGLIPLLAAFCVSLNPMLIMFGTMYAMIVLLIGWKLAEKKDPIVFFNKDKVGKTEGSEFQTPRCRHCGKPISSLFQIRCSGCGKIRF